MWFDSREEEVRQLEGEAYDALARGDWGAADAIAQTLLSMRWSGGFESAALAARGRGEPVVAVAQLEDAVAKVPAVWPLWHLLGVVRSDLGRYDEALDAFERALELPGSDAVSVRFNRAIAQHRRGEPGAALDDLELILSLPKPPPFAEDALSLAAECLSAIGRAGDGVAMVRAAYDACGEDDPRRARLAAELAIALHRAGGEASEIDERLDEAASGGVATPSFLALGRERHPLPARSARLHHLVLRAPPIAEGAAGLLRVFHVAADDVAQALSAARRYLPAAVRDRAEIEEHEERGPAASEESGVLWASGIIHYGDE